MPILDDPESAPEPLDLRLPVLALIAWAAALAAIWLPRPLVLAVAIAAISATAVGYGLRHQSPSRARWAGALACGLVCFVVATGTALRAERVHDGLLADLAQREAVVTAEMAVVSDPVLREGRFDDFVVLRAQVRELQWRGVTYQVQGQVVVIADPSWQQLELGSVVLGRVALSSTDGHDRAAALAQSRDDPEVVQTPDIWWAASSTLRAAIREATAWGRPAPSALVPALVDGDDAQLPAEVTEDFQVTGLTHLLAVSGTNLTLVVAFLILAARWCRVRGRWLVLVGMLGIGCFVLLARTEPSVVRAAAMGVVGVIALGSNGRQRGTRALAGAVLVLLLIDPWLAVSVGFVLSVLATAGILYLAPGWRDAMADWLPLPVAEAIAVPLAAQLACTPVVAAISGQVSLVAVVANLAAAPVVGPATILGLLGGLFCLVPWLGTFLGHLLGWLATWGAAWIIEVATLGADLPTAAVDWDTSPLSIAALIALCVAAVGVLPWILRSPRTGVGCCVIVAVVVLLPMPSPGWPPKDWLFVACDVGQGDGLVLNAGGGAAVVVDAGPDPELMDHCLDDLGVRSVPLVVLTHFHDDHVAGLSGVYDGRPGGEMEVTALADPPEGAASVQSVAAAAGVRVRVPQLAETSTVGAVSLQVLGPLPGAGTTTGGATDGEGSGPNNASLVLLAEVGGVRILLTGDIEPEAQRDVARTWPDLRVDVLKVPHHGSKHQDLDFLLGTRPRLAVISVGADNDYGHPSADLLAPLAAAGVPVVRTDQSGAIALAGSAANLRWLAR